MRIMISAAWMLAAGAGAIFISNHQVTPKAAQISSPANVCPTNQPGAFPTVLN